MSIPQGKRHDLLLEQAVTEYNDDDQRPFNLEKWVH